MTGMIHGTYYIGENAILSYSDKKSGGNCDVQFWSTTPRGAYLSLGDICESCPSGNNAFVYNSKPRGQTLYVAPFTGQESMLANPQDFTQIWTSKGVGSDDKGTVWAMNPPPGYVAIGHVVTYASSGTPPPPNVQNYWCVKAELAMAAQLGPQIWDTDGTGADSNLGVWQLVPANAQDFQDAGTFFATQSAKPTTVGAYVLRLGVVQFG